MSIQTIMSNVNSIVAAPAEALQLKGRKNRNVIYFTADIPVEIITAAGCVPYRVPSDLDEKQKRGNTTSVLQPYICSKSHQFFEFISNNEANLAAGIFSENHCDSLQNFYDVVRMNGTLDAEFPYFRFLLPINRGGKSETKYYFKELKRMISWFENWLGIEITLEKLLNAVNLHNSKRQLLKEISQFVSMSNIEGFSFAEFVKLKLATDIIPAEESVKILDSVYETLKKSYTENKNSQQYPRILISGSMFDNYKLFESIDILNKASVATDLSFISRSFDFKISLPTENSDIDTLLQNIASGYIVDKIPDSVHHYPGKRKEHLVKQIDKQKIEAIIFIHYSFCDPDAFETRSLTKYLHKNKEIPTLTLVTDPQLSNLNQMTTRVEAFLEKIGDV